MGIKVWNLYFYEVHTLFVTKMSQKLKENGIEFKTAQNTSSLVTLDVFHTIVMTARPNNPEKWQKKLQALTYEDTFFLSNRSFLFFFDISHQSREKEVLEYFDQLAATKNHRPDFFLIFYDSTKPEQDYSAETGWNPSKDDYLHINFLGQKNFGAMDFYDWLFPFTIPKEN